MRQMTKSVNIRLSPNKLHRFVKCIISQTHAYLQILTSSMNSTQVKTNYAEVIRLLCALHCNTQR